MALTGIHIVCANIDFVRGASLAIKPLWSQTLTAAGTTTRAAPSNASSGPYSAMFEVRSSADAFVAIGKTPDASQTVGVDEAARIFIPAGETRNLLCYPGDKIAWVAA